MTKDDYAVLEEIINEELEGYLQSGYGINDEYVIQMRSILKKLNLNEVYDYDKRFNKEAKQDDFSRD